MKRLASEVLRNLEIRVARLEKQSMMDHRNPHKFPFGIDMERDFTLSGNAGLGKDMFFPEDVPTKVHVHDGQFIVVLGGDKTTNVMVRNVVEKFASEESSHISIERNVKYPILEDIRVRDAAFVLSCDHHDLREFAPLANKLQRLGVKFDVADNHKRVLRVK